MRNLVCWKTFSNCVFAACPVFEHNDGNVPIQFFGKPSTIVSNENSALPPRINNEIAVQPKFAIHDVKNKDPFLYASTSLDTKAIKIASNRNFESCMSIRCLAPQLILRFFHFSRGFFSLPLAALLIIVSSSSTLHRVRSRYKKTCLQWVTFPGQTWFIVIDARRSHCPIGLRFQGAR